MSKALKRESDEDYKLKSRHDSVWITIGNISVNLQRRSAGVIVQLYPLHRETDDAITCCQGLFSDAEWECPECGRVYDDTIICTDDDCPGAGS